MTLRLAVGPQAAPVPWAAACAAALCFSAGCTKDETPRPEPPAAAASPARPAAPLVQIVPAEEGPVAPLVQHELEKARADGRVLLVDVGAPWCEPCTRFHAAAVAGELDALFPTLRLLEFDLDRDRQRLADAGYASRLIPLFALPLADGRSSGDQVEGAIKGEGAVGVITPRLAALVARAGVSSR
jgi:thiol-disulfide isomerase/thioredoxin